MRSTVAAFGAGRMGRGIAHVFAYAGYATALIDSRPRAREEFDRLSISCLAEIEAGLCVQAAAGLLSAAEIGPILARVELVPWERAEAALAQAELIFEAVPERLEAKAEALALMGEASAAEAIIASTTSTILVDTLASHVKSPQRFLNAHWLNPAFIVPLVELSPGAATDVATIDRIKSILEAVGKVPVVCRAAPGYIVPRIQTLAMNAAARLVEEGVASAEDIDKATRYGLGFRFAVLGVLEFIDWGGGDILYYASHYLQEALADPSYKPPAIIDRNMHEARNGLRDGRGFFDYAGVDQAAYQAARLRTLVELLRHMGLARPPAQAPANRDIDT